MKLIITGATGMVGSQVLQAALADNAFEEVTAITRKQLPINHSKLKTIIHQNFADYSNFADVFRNNDAVVWCLGISQNLVSKEEYIKITYNYTIAAAKDMLRANPSISFLFLSGEGADNTEKTRLLFGKIKGKTENALMQLPFKNLYIARPAAIIPSQKTAGFPFILRLQYAMVRLFAWAAPSLVITSARLAKALLHIIKTKTGSQLIRARELKAINNKL